MKKIFGIILFIIGILLISFSFILNSPDKGEKTKEETTPAKEETEVDKVNKILEDYILSDDNTIEKLKEVTNDAFDSTNLLFGKNTYISRKLSSEKIKENKLENYEKQQSIYENNVKKRFKAKIKYTGKKNGDGNIDYKIVSWYYIQYISDLMYIRNKMIFPKYTNASEDELDIYEYQAKVVAMKILDGYLSDYDETEEKVFVFHIKDGKAEENQYFSLYYSIIGINGKKIDNEARQKVLDTYYEKAISSGVVDSNNPLNLK